VSWLRCPLVILERTINHQSLRVKDEENGTKFQQVPRAQALLLPETSASIIPDSCLHGESFSKSVIPGAPTAGQLARSSPHA
jgi:hypothetical protein